ncbi:hypothetical protein TraAM80_08251 [Trypanosoma rangeli]|uniref:Uncharacterized protein n=1 Tax=Trypanosoma rangeli TaxID=5698 RepID=A0A422N1K9_TRYRA|nr:uncharacterized protein TraAM80_08251 [Trypanosoma rangeli]RNE99340.1 hypothetical protein TraAM80_08251 [Trypanosoma rangeli]|eukprot:RNE99340.1 hypothetical protein TraAM80_08251 [Trypanosoma rangeli]
MGNGAAALAWSRIADHNLAKLKSHVAKLISVVLHPISGRGRRGESFSSLHILIQAQGMHPSLGSLQLILNVAQKPHRSSFQRTHLRLHHNPLLSFKYAPSIAAVPSS